MCNIKDDACRYHPDLTRFSEVQGVNTECAVTHHKFKFFLSVILGARNSRMERKGKSGY